MVNSKSMKLESSIIDYESLIVAGNDNFDYNFKNTKNQNVKIFFTKYMSSMTKKILNEKINECKNEMFMKSYINYQLKEIKNNNDNYIFSNENLMHDIMNSGILFHTLLSDYSKSFFLIVEVIDIIFENLLSNIDVIPYSIKYICKMIFQLVKNKYKDERNEENLQIIKCVYLSKFFFNTLFLPILKNPTFLSLFSNNIISDTTIKNIQIISEILSQLISFRLFKNIKKTECYTLFNWYFLDKIPQLFRFMNEISKY